MRPLLVGFLSTVLLAGCSLFGEDTETVRLDLRGSVRVAETRAPAPGLDVWLQGALLDTPDLVRLLKRETSGADGAYALSVEIPVLRRADDGACIGLASSSDSDPVEVRLQLSVGDRAGLHVTAIPQCIDGPQTVDLNLEPLF